MGLVRACKTCCINLMLWASWGRQKLPLLKQREASKEPCFSYAPYLSPLAKPHVQVPPPRNSCTVHQRSVSNPIKQLLDLEYTGINLVEMKCSIAAQPEAVGAKTHVPSISSNQVAFGHHVRIAWVCCKFCLTKLTWWLEHAQLFQPQHSDQQCIHLCLCAHSVAILWTH